MNGGPPGVLYELLVACVYYGFVAASIAELASAIPSAGGVYHWASVTPGAKWGRVIGFFTGWLNFFGWIFDLASIVSIPANICVQFYALWHPEFVPEAWHTYVAFLLITWFGAGTCIFANRLIPVMQQAGLILIVVGGLVTIIVVAAMPAQHATSDFVWKAWDNQTGWSGGVAFLTGVLNGAFTIGTCDAVSHMAEELPNPRKDLPKAIAAQIVLGTISKYRSTRRRRQVLTVSSCVSLRHRHLVRHHRPGRCSCLARFISSCSRVLPSHGKQGWHIWSAIHRFSLNHDLRCWHVPDRGPYLVGAWSRQCDPIRQYFRSCQRDIVLPCRSDDLLRHTLLGLWCYCSGIEDGIQ